ncbi:hypothetical protein Q4490_03195 [Neptunomonas phycophila]|uniref:OmpH family outer membrane protein n=1 Tax=Neptunomonas phycophila TaxID=1572645 RepID=A0AAW7XG49_9GAMM|nr:hypothetical protein [Neptunomonas phycophila]MDO6452562.1 hypothetical protein [Neptunomonas phycophila]
MTDQETSPAVKSSKKGLVIGIITLLAIVIAAIAGYFAYTNITQQTAINAKELEQFGYQMVASSRSFESTGELGEKQIPSTFDEGKIPPTQKVIRGLLNDKDTLIQNNEALQQEIESLKARIADLEEYKQLNEHFAPNRLADELNEVERRVKAFLIRSSDAERFSTLQIEIMAAASAAEYKAYITRNRLMLSADQKQQVISDYLPAYAFCVGDGVDIAANSPQEERLLATYFRTDDGSILPQALAQDLSSVVAPCQLAIRTRLDNNSTDTSQG